jgi:hypothetical protein
MLPNWLNLAFLYSFIFYATLCQSVAAVKDDDVLDPPDDEELVGPMFPRQAQVPDKVTVPEDACHDPEALDIELPEFEMLKDACLNTPQTCNPEPATVS